MNQELKIVLLFINCFLSYLIYFTSICAVSGVPFLRDRQGDQPPTFMLHLDDQFNEINVQINVNDLIG